MAFNTTATPKGVKGIDTSTGKPTEALTDGEPVDGGPTVEIPKFKRANAFIEPTTEQEARLQNLGQGAFASSTGVGIAGTNLLVDKSAKNLFDYIDLAKGIPDQYERQKFIDENGSRMTQLLDPNKFGVRYNRDIQDYASIKAKNYDVQVKRFLDELDQNQGFLAAAGNTTAKLIGNTATAVTGIVPVVWGVGSAILNWDADSLFNNTMFDAWERADDAINTKFAVYGGASYSDPNKNFFARMIDNPMKSINADIAPAASFVAGAVLSELAAGALTATTGGAAAGAVVANTARLGAQATRLFGKSMRVIRGLDELSDFNNMRKIVTLTNNYKKAIGTVTSMVRTGGYESSLIARDTKERTMNQAKSNYIDSNPEIQDRIAKLSADGYSQEDIDKEIESMIPDYELERMDNAAENAGELAWFANVPLVGFSNMIQFSKVFNTGYRFSKGLQKLNPLKITGTVLDKTGQAVAKAETVGTARKVAAYGLAGVKNAGVESFEEFSQGTMEHGFADYYAAPFSKEAVKSSAGFVSTMVNAARNYGNSIEGQDSATIGALMGLIGIGLPVKVNEKTNKVGLGFKWYGGAQEDIKDLKEDIKKDKIKAKYRNDNPINPVLKNNFDNMMANVKIQSDMDNALERGDVFNYKNKEYEQLHSFVSNRIKNGLGDTIKQDLDAAQNLPLETFNVQYAFKDFPFTEETRTLALKKALTASNNIIEATDHVNTAFGDTRMFTDFFRRNYKGLQDPDSLTEPIKDQMAYLYGATINLKNRETELSQQIHDKSEGKLAIPVLERILAKVGGLNSENNLDFATSSREVMAAAMAEWKDSDPAGYNINNKQVKELLTDLIAIKDRKVKISAIYDLLFTNKGAKQYLDIYTELQQNRAEEVAKLVMENIKERAESAKSSTTSKAAKQDEESVTGDTGVTNSKISQELSATDEAMRSIIAETDPNAGSTSDLSTLIPNLDPTVVLAALEKTPAVFQLIIDRLKAQNKIIPGLSNIDQLADIMAENPDAANNIIKVFNEIMAEFNTIKPAIVTTLDYADPISAEQPVINPEVAQSTEQKYTTKLQELQESSIFSPGVMVGPNSIILITHDKKIDKLSNKVTRDPKTGRFAKWTDPNGNPTEAPVDTKKINSPEFLNNQELKSNDVEATFKIAESSFNNTPRSVSQIAIEVYQGDTLIGLLPAFSPGMPAHLLSLREAIVSQGASEVIAEETGISKEAAEKLAKVELANKIMAVSFSISKLDADYVQSVKDLEAKYSKKKGLKESLKDMFLNSADYVTEENELEADYKIEREKLIKEKAALQAALESQPTTKADIEARRKKSIDSITVLEANGENQQHDSIIAEINNEEKEWSMQFVNGESVDSYIEKIIKPEIKKIYDAELAVLEGKPTSRKETIDKNFDNIVKQLAKAKVNIFFNDKNEFKKC